MVFDSFFNTVFGPIMALPGPSGIIIVSFVITLLVTVIYKYTTDQELVKSMKEELKYLQKEVKDNRSNPEKATEIQKRAMEKQMKFMMHTMKPMLFYIIPLMLILAWLRNYYTALGNPKVLNLGFINLSWLWTYIIFSVIISIILRKIMKVH